MLLEPSEDVAVSYRPQQTVVGDVTDEEHLPFGLSRNVLEVRVAEDDAAAICHSDQEGPA